MDGNFQSTRRHLFIAGTGRAGTSFLVHYLTEIGLDTHLSRQAPSWDDNANAGLEDFAFKAGDHDLPYVVKWPWLYTCIDQMLENGTFRADAVIIPVRDLAEAAISRSIVERRAVHQAAEWMSDLNPSWEEWAHVPGGIIYSLNPVDQGRLLAVGFHHLVQRLVAANIPIVFLAFPRLAEDADYLFEKLRPLMPPEVSEEAARAAHARVMDESKIRVGGELQQLKDPPRPQFARGPRYASHAELEVLALKRELARLRGELSSARQEVAHLTEQERLQRSAAEQLRIALDERIAEQDEVSRGYGAALAAMSDLNEEHKRTIRGIADQVTLLQAQLGAAAQRNASLEETIASLKETIACLRTSRSWRLMRPYRAMGSIVKGVREVPSRLSKHGRSCDRSGRRDA